MGKPYILVVYCSEMGSTHNLAQSIARGVRAHSGIEARVRVVPSIQAVKSGDKAESDQGIAYVTEDDLANCAGLAVGSPTHFGNMASALQYWLEGTTSLWYAGAMIDKPASVFTSSASMHGGQETTLMNMMTPLLHLGMVIVGVPYAVPSLAATQKGGTPYGASHVSGEGGQDANLTEDEHAIAVAQGQRLAAIALPLWVSRQQKTGA